MTLQAAEGAPDKKLKRYRKEALEAFDVTPWLPWNYKAANPDAGAEAHKKARLSARRASLICALFLGLKVNGQLTEKSHFTFQFINKCPACSRRAIKRSEPYRPRILSIFHWI